MAQNLAGLFLDQSRIESAIKNFDPTADVIGPTVQAKYQEYEITRSGEKPAKLQIFVRADGTTTLHTKVGANQTLSLEIGEHVANECLKKKFEPLPLKLESISQSDWDFLIRHLREDWKYTVTEEPLQHGVRFKVKASHGDEIYLHRYNTAKFLMQGKALEAYGVVAMALCDLVPNKRQIIEAQLKSFDIPGVRAQDLLDQLREFAPNAVNILGEAGCAIIAPCLILIRLNIDLTDYSAFAYPAIRGLEAYMKAILASHKYLVSNVAGMGSMFNGPNLIQSVRTTINCQQTVDAVESSYALYNKHRHGLFHVDANPDTSRLLESKADAVNIVQEILRNIENTASLIPK